MGQSRLTPNTVAEPVEESGVTTFEEHLLTTPSPRRGEGYAALVPKALRHSWMRASTLRRRDSPVVRPPRPATTRQQAAKSAQLSPSKGKSKKGR